MKNRFAYILFFLLIAGFSKAQNLPDFRAVMNSQINNSEINVPKGTYLLDLTNNQWAYNIRNKTNVVIEGNGSTIICNRQTQALVFANCENVTFRNFIIEYDPPCSTQGTITNMTNNKNTWTVEIHENYPIDGLGMGRIQAYGKDTRELIPNFGTVSASNYTKIDNRTIQFTISWSNNPVQVGDFVSLDVISNNSHAHTIEISSCKNMKFENIIVYDSNCFSFLEYDGEANHYYRCAATRKVNDPKYPQDRLRAGIADAFHSKFAKVGPIVEECNFSHTGDDCIAINGNFYPVFLARESDPSIAVLVSGSTENVRVKLGDTLVCVANNGVIRGKAQVTRVRELIPTIAERQATFQKLANVVSSSSYTNGVRITLDKWIEGSDVGDVIYSQDRIGSGFIVINNYVGHNRSRAILIKSSDGIIEGNTIVNSAMSGIALAPEYYWMEAGCPKNVIIRNNTITNCMFESSMRGTYQYAPLVVVSEAPVGGRFAPAGASYNISIYNNIITDCPRPCIGVTSTDGLFLYDNEIKPATWTRQHGSDRGIVNNNDFFLVACRNVVTEAPTSLPQITKIDSKLFIKNNRIFVLGESSDENALIEGYDLTGRKIFTKLFSLRDGFFIKSLNKETIVVNVYCKTNVYTAKIVTY